MFARRIAALLSPWRRGAGGLKLVGRAKHRSIAANSTGALQSASQGEQEKALGWLIPLEGKHVGELLQLAQRVKIGSNSDNDIVLVEPSVSGSHAEIVARGTGFHLSDLDSTNGTWVNDRTVTSHELIDNDTVRIGRVSLRFKAVLG